MYGVIDKSGPVSCFELEQSCEGYLGRCPGFGPDGRYAAHLTGGILGEENMIVIVAAVDWHHPDSAALVTVYPKWDGDMGADHIDILFQWDMQLVRRRPLFEVLGRAAA